MPSAVRADECASYGPVAHLESPRYLATAPLNARFVVWISRSCGGVDGPAHRFRFVDAKGHAIAFTRSKRVPTADCTAPNCRRVRLDIDKPKPGTVELQVRRPRSATALGPWQRLTRIRLTGRRDTRPPRFGGISRARTRVVSGACFAGPGHARSCPVIETRLVFNAARDAGSPHDSLLYMLEAKHKGGLWRRLQLFRPTPIRGRRVSFRWKTSRGWGRRMSYRIRVIDAAGNKTLGRAATTLTNPSRPRR